MPERVYPLFDANFNVSSIVGDTDAGTAGNQWGVRERYRYEPYGDRVVLNADFAPDTLGGADSTTGDDTDAGWNKSDVLFRHGHQGGAYSRVTTQQTSTVTTQTEVLIGAAADAAGATLQKTGGTALGPAATVADGLGVVAEGLTSKHLLATTRTNRHSELVKERGPAFDPMRDPLYRGLWKMTQEGATLRDLTPEELAAFRARCGDAVGGGAQP
jgi:hypothetical protein